MEVIGKIFAYRQLAYTKLSTEKEDNTVYVKEQDVKFIDGMLYLRYGCRSSQSEGLYDKEDGGFFTVPVMRVSQEIDGFAVLGEEITEVLSEHTEMVLGLPYLPKCFLFQSELQQYDVMKPFLTLHYELVELFDLLEILPEEDPDYKAFLQEFIAKVQNFSLTFQAFLWMRGPAEIANLSDSETWERLPLDEVWATWATMVENLEDTRLILKIAKRRWQQWCQEESLTDLTGEFSNLEVEISEVQEDKKEIDGDIESRTSQKLMYQTFLDELGWKLGILRGSISHRASSEATLKKLSNDELDDLESWIVVNNTDSYEVRALIQKTREQRKERKPLVSRKPPSLKPKT
ncbi:MAG: hypothetical protein LBO09_06650 [Candidatus Peribacteria bacterium]|jgi:hypothetical protein|nr:hypothetical protein [Candidatus Peribacteria bacterium]